VLNQRSLLDSPALRLTTVGCSGGASWSPAEPVTTAAVVLVRRGVFRRRVNGVESLADTTTGYLQRPGEHQQVAHPAGGDVCTTIGVPPELADRLARAGPLTVPPAADVAHRRLLAAARHPGAGLVDLATEVLMTLLPATAPPRSHARIDDVRAALHTDPGLALSDLATMTGWSPWYLSRAFHQVTGVTLGTYRRRLRTRAALDALADGDSPAAVAARTGFADQAHLTREWRALSGLPPTRWLAAEFGFVQDTRALTAALSEA
jgi:AraC-like DNA-binding protein